MSTQLPFWSDDFDMDLLKVFRNVPELLGATADIPLWTVGHTTHGRLNHPTVWNSNGAFLWLEKPELNRDERGWFNIRGCVSNDSLVECSWLEFLRDEWSHHYGFMVADTLSDGYFQPRDPRDFQDIMWALRGWGASSTVASSLAKEWGALVSRNRRFAGLVEVHRLGREQFPYFAKGAVPFVTGETVAPLVHEKLHALGHSNHYVTDGIAWIQRGAYRTYVGGSN